MNLKKATSFLTLFSSMSTLVCCALPALFVILGFGAAFAGLVTKFPQMIWLSENKSLVFIFGGVMLALSGALQLRAKRTACPIDPELGEACQTTRDLTVWIYFCSLALYIIGAIFAFGGSYLL